MRVVSSFTTAVTPHLCALSITNTTTGVTRVVVLSHRFVDYIKATAEDSGGSVWCLVSPRIREEDVDDLDDENVDPEMPRLAEEHSLIKLRIRESFESATAIMEWYKADAWMPESSVSIRTISVHSDVLIVDAVTWPGPTRTLVSKRFGLDLETLDVRWVA